MEIFLEAGGIFGNLTQNALHKITIAVTAFSNVDILCINTEAFYLILEVISSVKNCFFFIFLLQKYPWIKSAIEPNLTKNEDYMLPAVKVISDITDQLSVNYLKKNILIKRLYSSSHLLKVTAVKQFPKSNLILLDSVFCVFLGNFSV